MLHWRELIVFKVIEEARKHLDDITRNENPCYVKMLYLLIEEGIFLVSRTLVEPGELSSFFKRHIPTGMVI